MSRIVVVHLEVILEKRLHFSFFPLFRNYLNGKFTVRALGILRWKCLVCTFSLEDSVKEKWDIREGTPRSGCVVAVSQQVVHEIET